MLTGYNTDFKFQGKVYHIQTEDGGIKSPYIISLLYHGGAIIASRKTSYDDIVKADCLDEVVREIMMEQHKQMIRDLMEGKLEINKPPGQEAPQAATPQESAPKAKGEPVPVQVIKPALPPEETDEKSLDEIILDFLAQSQKSREQKK